MRRRALAILLFACAGPALADDIYPYDLPKAEPKAFAAWQGIVPKKLHKTAWIYRLKGTASPIAHKTVGGIDLLAGWACKPHDCGDNGVTFLISRDGSHAVGTVRLKGAAHSAYLGSPSDEEKAALDGLYPGP